MKTVAIMLCTYNGERFLDAQLQSLAQQTVTDLVVLVSDDGSTDNTLQIIEQNRQKFPHLNIKFLDNSLRDSRKGFQYNFLSIFNLAEPPAAYIAYADQDDIWEKDKLECALNYLQQLPDNQPGLYGSRTRLIDESNQELGFSRLFTKKPCFATALVQNILGGNTMVFNTQAWHLMKRAQGPAVFFHDWWTYLVVSAAGGHVFYDACAKVNYRQHSNNLIGRNNTFKAHYVRLKKLLQGQWANYNRAHVAALFAIKHLLTPENQHLLYHFAQAREAGFIGRMRYILSGETFRQTFFETLGYWVAIVFRKF